MKTAFVGLMILLVFGACMTAQKRLPVAAADVAGVEVPSEKSLGNQIVRLQGHVETSLAYRARMLAVAHGLMEKSEAPLTGRDLEVLRSGTRAYLDLREQLYEAAHRYEKAVDDDQYTDKRLRLKAVCYSLAAALVLYDNYLSAVAVFEDDARLRRLINDSDSGFEIDAGMLETLSASAASVGKRQRIRRAIGFVESERERMAADSVLMDDDDYQYLISLIDQSPSYNYVRNLQVAAVSSHQIQLFTALSTDLVAEVRDDGVNLVSLIFGNAMGLYESRKGKLYGDEAVAMEIAHQLKPLDILLEKTPFRLTDRFIPGHFGHVAIWLGTEADLKEMGIWEHPVVVPHHTKLRAGESRNILNGALVLEALRSGVQLNTLVHFMNVDDVAVIRPSAVQDDPEAAKEAMLLAFRQIGKAYDFNFDVNTTEKIVCSELAYVTFPSISWPTESTLGRDTISPDQVARLAWAEDGLSLVLFYHDGARVDDDVALEKAKKLVEGE